MKVFLKLYVVVFLIFLTGCSLSTENADLKAPGRLVLGPSIEKKAKQTFELKGISRIDVDIGDGSVDVRPWDKDYIQVVSVTRLQAPVPLQKLGKAFSDYKFSIASDSYSLNIKTELPEKEMLLSHFTTELEIDVPEKSFSFDIEAANGVISLNMQAKAGTLEATLDSGKIEIKDCRTSGYTVKLGRGNLLASDVKGNGNVKLSGGEAVFENVLGDLQYKSEAGETRISGAVGVMDCEIYTGKLEIQDSYIKAASSFYATNGEIKASGNRLDSTGKYDFEASDGDIFVYMPANAGFNLKAKAEYGEVKSDFKPEANSKDLAETGKELSGVIGNNGPDINAYVYRGSISILRK